MPRASRAAVARIKRTLQAAGRGRLRREDRRAERSAIAQRADGVVVGSALVDALRATLDANGKATAGTVKAVTDLVAELAAGVRAAKRVAAE